MSKSAKKAAINDRMSLRNKIAFVTGAGWPMTAVGGLC